MEKQKQRIHECIDGRCPPDIDLVKEIGLSSLEKKAIFFCLQNEISRAKKTAAKSASSPLLLKSP